jgi:hypothetical protein
MAVIVKRFAPVTRQPAKADTQPRIVVAHQAPTSDDAARWIAEEQAQRPAWSRRPILWVEGKAA